MLRAQCFVQLLTLIEKQRDAVKQAAEYLQLEKGKLVYITRSILREENEDQVTP